jgi:hypothetical protein
MYLPTRLKRLQNRGPSGMPVIELLPNLVTLCDFFISLDGPILAEMRAHCADRAIIREPALADPTRQLQFRHSRVRIPAPQPATK